MKKFKYELGEVLKDKITGYQGVVMVRSEYFTGCTTYGLCSQTLKEGIPMEWEWIDGTRLFRVDHVRELKQSTQENGGVHPYPPQLD